MIDKRHKIFLKKQDYRYLYTDLALRYKVEKRQFEITN
jgi:hypothetical protein